MSAGIVSSLCLFLHSGLKKRSRPIRVYPFHQPLHLTWKRNFLFWLSGHWCSLKSGLLNIWTQLSSKTLSQEQSKQTFYREMTLCGLLANINVSAASMGRAAICICHGWAFVWQERLRNRSCWQHVGADLRRPGSQRETTGGSPKPRAATFSGLGGSPPCLFAVLAFRVGMEDHDVMPHHAARVERREHGSLFPK